MEREKSLSSKEREPTEGKEEEEESEIVTQQSIDFLEAVAFWRRWRYGGEERERESASRLGLGLGIH